MLWPSPVGRPNQSAMRAEDPAVERSRTGRASQRRARCRGSRRAERRRRPSSGPRGTSVRPSGADATAAATALKRTTVDGAAGRRGDAGARKSSQSYIGAASYSERRGPARSPDRTPRRPPSRRPRRLRCDASPATAPSIAMRWSPCGVDRAAAQRRAVAAHDEAVVGSPRCPRPAPRRPSTTPAIRSDSLRRSSSAPAHDRLALGEARRAAPRASARRSRAGPPPARRRCPRAAPTATSSSPTGSSSGSVPGSSRSPTITAPMRSRDPEEAGARPVQSDVRRPPRASRGTSVAAATMNAADEGSPGTTISSSSSSSTCATRASAARRARTARARGAACRSVWSRLGRRLGDASSSRRRASRRSARTT